MSQIVEIDNVNTNPQQEGRFLTQSVLWINAPEHICGVKQRSSNDVLSRAERFEFVLTFNIAECGNLRVESSELKEYLRSPHAQELLNRICKNWFNDFNGKNWFGYLLKDASTAVDELLSGISKLPHSKLEYKSFPISAEEWIDRDEIEISAFTPDTVLEVFANEIEQEAMGQDVVIEDNVYNQLETWRDEVLSEWLNRAKAAVPNGWAEDVTVTYCLYDDERLEVELYFSDESYGSVLVSENETMVLVAPQKEVELNIYTW